MSHLRIGASLAFILALTACSHQNTSTTALPEKSAVAATEESSKQAASEPEMKTGDAEKASARPTHWGYEGEVGPGHWGSLDPAYSACSTGKMQSPVDIPPKAVDKSKGFVMSYGNSRRMISRHEHVDDILDNGHTIQVTLEEGGTLQTASGDYRLAQLHFHSPSENKVNGKQYPLEVHLVHQSTEGKFAVVALFFEEGKANPLLESLIQNFPENPGESKDIDGTLDLTVPLAGNIAAWHFFGSFTTPPCTEDIEWFILKESRKASKTQLEGFAKHLNHNNRPVQPWNDRALSVDEYRLTAD